MRRLLVVVACVVVACVKFTSNNNPVDGGIEGTPADAPVCSVISIECVDGATLRTCNSPQSEAIDTPCSWGCITSPTAHCGRLSPAGGGATSSNLDPGTFGSTTDQVLSGTVNGDTGTINGVMLDGVTLQNNIAVFRFKSLHVIGPVTLVGTRPIALAVDGPVVVDAVIDVRGCANGSGTTPGPGGFAGGQLAGAPAAGSGGGDGGVSPDGGAGGGRGAIGGNSGTSAGGLEFGDPQISVLEGGGGGGAGDGGGNFGRGGGGGGAVHLISNTSISIGAAGGVNAGGCGGSSGGGLSDTGGGAGAGGTILIEAPDVSIVGVVAANGGGGGGGGGTGAGKGADGRLDRARTIGGIAGVNGGAGASGGAGSTPDGAPALQAAARGGGGGGIGRIRINTKGGMTLVTGVMSPAFTDPIALATQGLATVQ